MKFNKYSLKTIWVPFFYTHLQDLIMKLLEAMEAYLGPIDGWPSYILRYLFTDCASPVQFIRLWKVIAFFYGNGIPCALACRFYKACNWRRSSFINEEFHDRYRLAKFSNSYKPHMSSYYNICHGKFFYVSGLQLNQQELVLPEVHLTDFAIEGTGCPCVIHGKLELVYQEEVIVWYGLC